MVATVTSGSATAAGIRFFVRHSGGERLQRHLKIQGDDELKARLFAEVLRRELLPELRRLVPRRTGRLQKSLRIVQRGTEVSLRGVFYGNLVVFQGGKTVASVNQDLFGKRHRELALLVHRKILALSGV